MNYFQIFANFNVIKLKIKGNFKTVSSLRIWTEKFDIAPLLLSLWCHIPKRNELRVGLLFSLWGLGLLPLTILVGAKIVIACNSVLQHLLLMKLSLLTSETVSSSWVSREFKRSWCCRYSWDVGLSFRTTKRHPVSRHSNKFLYLKWVRRLTEVTLQLSG